ncbi:MAG: ABC transporter ATP-binding protein [SAR86 cluster bacterium]|uniref:ABC transporter ATP-binding protein n=1 Tax=SAR86 cluster bacterium TaxID=2030880 RepID=A0A2A5ATS4_9GAMM|nr:MAG: ABC transporter ATP-binding protein [SAR86 cluster bacterium]
MIPVQINNVTISYGYKVIFENLNVNFETGCHALIGPNGSGKSTILKALAGINSVQKGSISIFGHSLSDEPVTVKRSLSYMPDTPIVYPFMRGRELLEVVAQAKKVAPGTFVNELLESLQIDVFSETAFSEMSFGTQRKFTLVAALIGDPELILMDEPINGLDKNCKEFFVDYINQHKDSKVFLFASHSEDLCDLLGAEKHDISNFQESTVN